MTARLSLPDDGWKAALRLRFAARPERTVLTERRHSGPLTVQRPFYPEGAPCHLYVLHPPGGVVGGDGLSLDIHLDAHSHALLTMPGATKFYRSAGPVSRLVQHFQVAENAMLEWLPQDSIFFPGARAALESRFELASGARLLAWESLCLGRPVMQETFSHGQLDSRISLFLDGQPLLHERLRLSGGALARVADFPLLATFFAYPATPELLDLARSQLANARAPAGATLLDGLLVVRLLEHDNQRLQATLQQLWRALRPAVAGCQPCPPRIWAT